MKNYGRRVQYSVFECELTEGRFLELYGKLADLLQETGDHEDHEESEEEKTEENSSNSIRIYRLCKNCVEQIQVIGVEKQRPEDEDIIII